MTLLEWSAACLIAAVVLFALAGWSASDETAQNSFPLWATGFAIASAAASAVFACIGFVGLL